MKASGLRLEAIRVIAREQGVEIENTACRCIDESLLAELADAHVRRMKAYFNNARRHIAKLNGDDLAVFIDFYKNHILYYAIEGDNSHAHNVYVDSKTGEIGRKTHSKKNRIELDQKEWNIVNKLSGWTKKKN